jgi:hypothetical protein
LMNIEYLSEDVYNGHYLLSMMLIDVLTTISLDKKQRRRRASNYGIKYRTMVFVSGKRSI